MMFDLFDSNLERLRRKVEAYRSTWPNRRPTPPPALLSTNHLTEND